MAKKGARTGVRVQSMTAFGRVIGEPLTGGESLYSQVSRRLCSIGHGKHDGESDRNHCIRLEDVIKDAAKGHHKPKRKKSDNPKAGPITLGTDTDVRSTEFLSTYAWRKVRMEALKKYGPVCQCCGASPATGAVMNVDHIKPRKLFPELALDLDNLQILCAPCNHGKGNWDDTDWR